MSANIKQFHTEVYHYLNEQRRKESSLRYTYRKSNYGGKLEDGYWFYGTENYFCISFWSGMDWKNRTPNICFIYLPRGEARLEINISDSDRKREFIEKYMVEPLQLEIEGRRYVKRYGVNEDAGIDFLKYFLRGGVINTTSDKQIIDEIIRTYGTEFFEEDNAIGFIDQYEFRSRDVKIKKYYDQLVDGSLESHQADSKPSKIKSISLKSYQGIYQASLKNIGIDTQWIFLTGENGSGKTSILKAISATLGYKVLEKSEIEPNQEFKVEMQLYKGREVIDYYRTQNIDCNKRFPLVSGLAIFGPNRLISNKGKTDTQSLNNALKKEGIFAPLWNFEYRMIDIEVQFDLWRDEGSRGSTTLEKRIYFIRTLLSRVVPGLYDIRFKKENNKSKNVETKYIVRKDDFSNEEEKYWQQLPSGTRSVFAMVSEILIKLYHFQKDIIDPSELTGIVIIDEIDLHLHPNAQRQLIVDLTEVFRSVQFIVATHSPIPLLGAPENSVFAKISRTVDCGIIIERLEEIEKNIGNLLPNILYTSSVFGMTELISVANSDKKEIMTQDNSSDAKDYKRLKEKLGVKPIDESFISNVKRKLKE